MVWNCHGNEFSIFFSNIGALKSQSQKRMSERLYGRTGDNAGILLTFDCSVINQSSSILWEDEELQKTENLLINDFLHIISRCQQQMCCLFLYICAQASHDCRALVPQNSLLLFCHVYVIFHLSFLSIRLKVLSMYVRIDYNRSNLVVHEPLSPSASEKFSNLQ